MGKNKILFNEFRISVLKSRNIFGDGSSDSYTTVWIYLVWLNFTLKTFLKFMQYI